MTDEFTVTGELPEPAVMVPSLCAPHMHELVVQRLRIPESGPWQTRMVIAQMLLFQWTATDPRFWQRCGRTKDERDVAAMNLVLAEIGCLACWSSRGFQTIWQMMRDDLEGAIAASKRGDWAMPFFPKSAEDPT